MSWQIVSRDAHRVRYERTVPGGVLVAVKDGYGQGWWFTGDGGLGDLRSDAPSLLEAMCAADEWAEGQGWPVQREQADH